MSVVRPAVSDIITVNSKKFVPTDGCCLILIIPVLLSRVNVSKKINNTLINVLYLNIHYIQSNLHIWSPLLNNHLYQKITFFLSCHKKFHMNCTSFKRSLVKKDHLFFVPEVTS
jgi:hypothetical protein